MTAEGRFPIGSTVWVDGQEHTVQGHRGAGRELYVVPSGGGPHRWVKTADVQTEPPGEQN